MSTLVVVSMIAAEPAHATGLQTTVMSPITGRVTSSPQEPHHRPYGGDYSFDVAAGGGDVYASFRNTNGSLSLTVAQTGRACASGNFADGGDKIVLNININGSKVGTVTYAHLTNFSYISGNVPVGARLGRMVTNADGVYKNVKPDGSYCWGGPHVHVEPGNNFRYGCFINDLQGASINTGQPLGIVGGERAGAVNTACGANPETPPPADNDPRGSFSKRSPPRAPGWPGCAGGPSTPTTRPPPWRFTPTPGDRPGPRRPGLQPRLRQRVSARCGRRLPGSGEQPGFDVTFETRSGSFTMYIYAINRPGTPGGNVLLGTRNVNVADPSPIGSFDTATSPQAGEIAVGGWTFDPSNRSVQLGVHIYVGGPAGDGAAEFHDGGAARGYRPDVDDVFAGAGDYHGFEVSFATRKSGAVPVFVYAIDVGPGENKLIGSRTVQVVAGVPRISGLTRPRISGTPRVGSRLTSLVGSWLEKDVTYSYRWRRNGRAIRGATGRTYRVVPADRGRRISVRVTARKLGYAPGGQNSATTGRIR